MSCIRQVEEVPKIHSNSASSFRQISSEGRSPHHESISGREERGEGVRVCESVACLPVAKEAFRVQMLIPDTQSLPSHSIEGLISIFRVSAIIHVLFVVLVVGISSVADPVMSSGAIWPLFYHGVYVKLTAPVVVFEHSDYGVSRSLRNVDRPRTPG
ncbi:hypothetical protein J6590_003453 [Homalodisca vitripennis]|nr:hypothetical protein J6590_003453 [Homalodisca vitripennis]